MPQLACNPILVNLSGLSAGLWVTGTLTLRTVRLDKTPANQPLDVPNIEETLAVTLRSNHSGNVVGFDISPFVANFARKHFYAGLAYGDILGMDYPFNINLFSYSLSIDGVVRVSDKVLFGAGDLTASGLQSPYILRRNRAALHAYQGLPFTFSTYGPMKYNILNSRLEEVFNAINNDIGYLTEYSMPSLPVGDYTLIADDQAAKVRWNDSRIWNDYDVWNENAYMIADTAVYYPLHVHASPADCIWSGAKIYVRYWNSRGAWSYALLQVQYNDLQAKTTYADAWRLDATPVDGRIFGDRVQTEKEMTYTITAGRDGLDRADVDELRDLQRSWCVQLWDIDFGVWRDCYVKDATTRNAGGRGQEMTFTIEMPHEYTFTR